MGGGGGEEERRRGGEEGRRGEEKKGAWEEKDGVKKGGGRTLPQEKCGPFCHSTPNFSFDYFICYQDKSISCFVEIFEGGKVCVPALKKHYKT